MISAAAERPDNPGGMNDNGVKAAFCCRKHRFRCLRFCFGIAARYGLRGKRLDLPDYGAVRPLGDGVYRADVNEPFYAVFPAEPEDIFRSVYIDIINQRGNRVLNIDDSCRVDHISFFAIPVFKQRTQSIRLCNVSLVKGNVFRILCLLFGENQPPYLAVFSFQHPDDGAAKVACGPCNDIKLFHVEHHSFPNTVLIFFP